MKHCIVIQLFLLVSASLFAQKEGELEINDVSAVNELGAFYTDLPAFSTPTKTQLHSAYILYKQHTGMFKDIKQSNAYVSLYKKRSRFGMSMQNNQEGEFIKRNKAYLFYGVHLQLNKQFKFGAEFDAGFIQMSIGDGIASELTNDFSLDANTRLMLYSKKHFFTLGLNHINQPVMKPLKYEIQYPYNSFAHYTFKSSISETVSNRSFLMCTYSRAYNAELSLGTKFYWQEIGSLGASIQQTGDLLLLADVDIINKETHAIQFIIAYEIQNYNNKREYAIPTFQAGVIVSPY